MRDDVEGLSVTALAATAAIEIGSETIPQSALESARLSTLDWAAVAIAGVDEPSGALTRRMVEAEGGRAEAVVLGSSSRLPARAAALANGAISHALDYDDTHFDHVGHPSVAILPAALAVAERAGASGRAMLEAFLIGAEISCRIGRWLGTEHYQHGFHQTATAGAFGAAAAAARLMALDVAQTRHALGLVSGRASGLKSQFGTMGKPLNAGLAAANGVEAASLAALGFVSRPDGLECLQGFADTHAAARRGREETAEIFDGLGRDYRFERVRYKHHACCHGLHAALEAIAELRTEGGVDPARLTALEIRTAPRWLRVCDIAAPQTGLEAKFSYRLAAAMGLSGVDTAALDVWSDATCADPALLALRDRVRVVADPTLSDTQAVVIATTDAVTTNAATWTRSHDLDGDGGSAGDRAVLAARLEAKAAALLGAEGWPRLRGALAALDEAPASSFADALAALSAARRH